MSSVCRRARQLQRSTLYIVALLALTGGILTTDAQIYEWVDDDDNRHYVTSLDRVPENARAKASLFVKEGATPVTGGEASTSAGGEAEPGAVPSATTEVDGPDSFASGWDAGFRAGWDAGYRYGSDEEPICPAEPEVVVLESPVVVDVPRYDPTGAYYVSPYEGTVTVPFDGGRSRGLTRRQQIQEQRRIERGR